MKRVFAATLAVLLAAGMTLPAFAAEEPVPVYGDDTYIDLSEGESARPEEDVEEIEVYIGEGVSITVPMEEGKLYSGSVMGEPDEDDDAMMEDYPDIVYVLNLKTKGLNALGDTVTIEAAEDFDFYVYNRDLKYLGRSSENLPYATKYYLAEEKLVDPSTEPTDASQPATSGNAGGYTPNPDTGDTSFLGIALAALALSGVVIGVAAKKRKN